MAPGWGSWDWIGSDLGTVLAQRFATSVFQQGEIPRADVVVIVKHPPPPDWWVHLPARTRVLYCPVDYYGSAEGIAGDADWLRRCSRIIVHCERLRPYFAAHAPVEYLDHHVKFVTADLVGPSPHGPLLWTGVHSNLGPLAKWMNQHALPRELCVLTNIDEETADPRRFGFQHPGVRIQRWTPERHLEMLQQASGAFDVKGDDFRQQHKPAAKAIDFIASGLPLAMNADSSSAEHLRSFGFEMAAPEDQDRWFSAAYLESTRKLGRYLRESLSCTQVAQRLGRIIQSVLDERERRGSHCVPTVGLPVHQHLSPRSSAHNPYAAAMELAEQGFLAQAVDAYRALPTDADQRQQALVENDLGVLAVLQADAAVGRKHFEAALVLHPGCESARENLQLLSVDDRIASWDEMSGDAGETVELPTKVAIVSLLFNWPSTGGGTVHTAETAKFLSRAGYEVRHFYAQYAGWGVGNVDTADLVGAQAIRFDELGWTGEQIQRRFREAVDEFEPDFVIVTDSWNFKPLLAEAVSDYPYFLRLAALETLCPLNNVRLLADASGISACPRQQLATPRACQQCVAERWQQSGGLHQAERALAGFGGEDYDRRLREAYANAEGVLVVNPLIAAMVSPYARAVHVVPSGFDPARFPWPWPATDPTERTSGRTRLFFVGLVDEFMKGFRIVHEACRQLWAVRQDFELVATGEPVGNIDPFTRFIGWQTQEELPRQLRAADVLVFPTIAEEALGRSAVEAMGVGRPVIASRIGGLQFTVTDGATGLLFDPGDPADLARKIARLLNDPELRTRMGIAGRKRFEAEFTWDAIIERHYRPLLAVRPELAELAPV